MYNMQQDDGAQSGGKFIADDILKFIFFRFFRQKYYLTFESQEMASHFFFSEIK